MKVIWSDHAVSDLRRITNRIRQDNPSAAAKLAARIFNELQTLSTNSFRGHRGKVTDTLELIFAPTKYIAVYKVIGGQVRIMRIRHGAQDWPPS